jgi:peptidoglycan LD-endopeptidase LytH
MRHSLLLILPFLLIACNFGTVAAPAAALPLPSLPPSSTFLPVPPTPTPTPSQTKTPSPSETQLTKATDTGTATITLTKMPAQMPNLYPHVFPVQPEELAGFSRGGHAYPATDIFAPPGAQFVAVTNGTVDEVSYVDQWNPVTNDNGTAGGLSVRIIGDDGVRYYGAHLSKIAPGIRSGVWVPAGQVLGLVGNTGNARDSATHVHFEITSPAPPFSKVDPFPYLTAWLNDHNVTPALPIP